MQGPFSKNVRCCKTGKVGNSSGVSRTRWSAEAMGDYKSDYKPVLKL